MRRAAPLHGEWLYAASGVIEGAEVLYRESVVRRIDKLCYVVGIEAEHRFAKGGGVAAPALNERVKLLAVDSVLDSGGCLLQRGNVSALAPENEHIRAAEGVYDPDSPSREPRRRGQRVPRRKLYHEVDAVFQSGLGARELIVYRDPAALSEASAHHGKNVRSSRGAGLVDKIFVTVMERVVFCYHSGSFHKFSSV